LFVLEREKERAVGGERERMFKQTPDEHGAYGGLISRPKKSPPEPKPRVGCSTDCATQVPPKVQHACHFII